MRRRDLLAASVTLAAAAGAARADEATTRSNNLDMAVIALPVIADGLVRNYIFVRVRLRVALGGDPAILRPKEAFYRDHLVRAAHATPFTLPDNWNRLNGRAMAESLLAAGTRISGPRVVRRVEIIDQRPRRTVTVGA